MADGSSSCGSIDQALTALQSFAGSDKKVQNALKQVDLTFRRMQKKASGLETQAWQLGALKDRLQASLNDQLGTPRVGTQVVVGTLGGVVMHTAARKIYGAITNASPSAEALGFFRRPSTHLAAIDFIQGASFLIGGAVVHARKRAQDPHADPYLSVGSVMLGGSLIGHGLNTLAERYI